MKRRTFIRNTSLAATALTLQQSGLASFKSNQNKLPKWKGFNLTDFFSPDPSRSGNQTTEDHLK